MAETREAYIKNIFEIYQLATVLSDKNNCKVFRLRHKELNKDIVLHSFPKAIPIYNDLLNIKAPFFPEIYDVINLDDGQIVLEEYIDGITIAEIMESGKYHYRGARAVMKAVCEALTFLHKKGVAHRDIKPENIMIDSQGRVVLIDFNTSKQVTKSNKDTVIMGTVGYASPEQLGVAPSDARTDIYAAGVLLNVMLTGKHPSEQLASGRGGRIVRKCTHINPKDRYQSAEKLAEAL